VVGDSGTQRPVTRWFCATQPITLGFTADANIDEYFIGEKNRLLKLLTDAGTSLPVVVSDIHGKSRRAMIKGLLDGAALEQMLKHADQHLMATEEELFATLADDLTPCHLLSSPG
jgi:hypothetical protein